MEAFGKDEIARGIKILRDKLIKFFVYKSKGHISTTQLISWLYLADLYAVKWTGKQLTDLDWCFWQNRLYRKDVDLALARMNGKEIDLQQSDGGTILIRLGKEAGAISELELTRSLELVLENIRREWAGSGVENRKQLASYLAITAPILDARKHHSPENKVKLDLALERAKLLQELEN